MPSNKIELRGVVISTFTGKPLEKISVTISIISNPEEFVIANGLSDNTGNFSCLIDPDHVLKIMGNQNEVTILLVISDGASTIQKSNLPIHHIQHNSSLCIEVKHIAGVDRSEHLEVFHGLVVNRYYLKQLTTDKLRDACNYMLNGNIKLQDSDLIQLAFPLIFNSEISKGCNCGAPVAEAFKALFSERGEGEEMMTRMAYEYANPGLVKSHYTDNVVVRYVVDPSDANAIPGVLIRYPTADEDFILSDGTNIGTVRTTFSLPNTELAPERVQRIALYAEYARTKFMSPPCSFSDPREPGGRFEIRLWRLEGTGGGRYITGSSFVVVNSTFTEDFPTVSHEMFHKIQYNYVRNAGPGELDFAVYPMNIFRSFIEGGATLSEDIVENGRNSTFYKGARMLEHPHKSMLDLETDYDFFYSIALFWRYLCDHYGVVNLPGQAANGIDAYRHLIDAMGTVAYRYSLLGVDATRVGSMPWQGCNNLGAFSYATVDLPRHLLNSPENIYRRGNIWADFLAANYLHTIMVPGTPGYQKRFHHLPYSSGSPSFHGIPATSQDVSIFRNSPPETHTIMSQKPVSARYFLIDCASHSPGPRSFRIQFDTLEGMEDPVVQIIQIGESNQFADRNIYAGPFVKSINATSLQKVLVIVGTWLSGGSYSLNFQEFAGGSDVMITRGKCAEGKEDELWHDETTQKNQTPDVLIDNNRDNIPDKYTENIIEDGENRLRIRIRNKGTVAANNVRIDIKQGATKRPDDTRDRYSLYPIKDGAGNIINIAGISLAPGEVRWIETNWYKERAYDGSLYINVISPDDINTDNKYCVYNIDTVD